MRGISMKKTFALLTGTFFAVSSFTTFFAEQTRAKNLDEDFSSQDEKGENDKMEISLVSSEALDKTDETKELDEAEKEDETAEVKEDQDSSDAMEESQEETKESTTESEEPEESASSETTSVTTEQSSETSNEGDKTTSDSNFNTDSPQVSSPTAVEKNSPVSATKQSEGSIAKKTTKVTSPKSKKVGAYPSSKKQASFIPTKVTNKSSGINGNEYIGENSYTFSPNFTTQRFVQVIGEDARRLGQKHGLYASVMIAQAILESASGNSSLASPPNYNLFGIKGSYHGTSVNFATQEDDGSGNHFTIRANFRKYPSYKESLEDYVHLIRGGLPYNHGFYSGVWKSNTQTYQDATRFLMGRYATDTSYAAKLNGLIKAYNLTIYDTSDGKIENIASTIILSEKNEVADVRNRNTTPTKIQRKQKETRKIENKATVYHEVQVGESLISICRLYQVPLNQIVSHNDLSSYLITVGQVLDIGKTIRLKEEEKLDYATGYFDMNLEHFSKPAGKDLFLRLNTPFFKNYSVKAYRERPAGFYSVQRGDTLAKISKRFGISVQSLRRWNNLNSYLIYEGQQLRLTPWLNDPLSQGFITI